MDASYCGSCPARSKALGSEPSLVGVRAFESHLPHVIFMFFIFIRELSSHISDNRFRIYSRGVYWFEFRDKHLVFEIYLRKVRLIPIGWFVNKVLKNN